MRQQCTSIAKSTNDQCRKKAFPGSRYCVLHIEKPPLIVGAVVGVILGYLINWVLPTPELRALRQLRKDVQPVISLAKSSFPDLNRSEAIGNLTHEVGKLRSDISKYQIDLKIKEDQIKELEIKAKKAERGIFSVYDFDGNKRTGEGHGKTSFIVGPNLAIFQKILELEKQKNYSELIAICERQIKETPEWLTPYLFLGIAYANTSNKARAIELFEYVLENAPDDPNYAQANELLKILRE